MEIVIKLSDDVYTRLFDNGTETNRSDQIEIETAIRRGVQIVFNDNTKTPILDVIHKTIYQFFDVCSDDEEIPISDKDKLLLEVNKAICDNLKALEQEPCEDAISRQAAIDTIESWLSCDDYNKAERHIMRAMQSVLYDLPPVTPQPKTGHWIPTSERSPKEHGEYEITWTTSLAKLNNQGFIGIAEYELTGEFEHENNRFKGKWLLEDDIKNYPDVKVTAWMPLPEPYTVERSEE